MAKVKKQNTYSTIADDLTWLEEKAHQIKEFVDDNPYHLVTDRNVVSKKTYDKFGEMNGEEYKLVATIEQIQKSLRDSLKEYAQLIEVIEKLREKEEAKKVATRGDKEISFIARKTLL